MNLLGKCVHVPMHQRAVFGLRPVGTGSLKPYRVGSSGRERAYADPNRGKSIGPAQFFRALVHCRWLTQKKTRNPTTMRRRRLISTQIQGQWNGRRQIFGRKLRTQGFEGYRHNMAVGTPFSKPIFCRCPLKRFINKPNSMFKARTHRLGNPLPISVMRG